MRLSITVISRWLLATVALATLLASACGDSGSPPESSGRTKVTVTLPLLADFVKRVVLPSGADPHTFDLTPRAVQRLSEADIVFINGLGLEAASLKVIANNKRGDAPLVALAERVADQAGEQATGNPHLWLDVSLASRYAEVIRDDLSAIDTQGAEAYRANAEAYRQELETLGEDLRALVASVPPERRWLVTSHDAFPYLARLLDLEVAAVVVSSPGQEPSPQDLAGLLRQVEDLGIPAVFVEPQAGAEGRLLRQLAEDAGLRVCTLYSDALDERAPTYVDMMAFNGQELARCLGGEGG
jgi:zinc/manganese transport system substrate-binding protein/manganese/iron transport system substrate-binding protein